MCIGRRDFILHQQSVSCCWRSTIALGGPLDRHSPSVLLQTLSSRSRKEFLHRPTRCYQVMLTFSASLKNKQMRRSTNLRDMRRESWRNPLSIAVLEIGRPNPRFQMTCLFVSYGATASWFLFVCLIYTTTYGRPHGDPRRFGEAYYACAAWCVRFFFASRYLFKIGEPRNIAILTAAIVHPPRPADTEYATASLPLKSQ
ncbi:hypothetical protein QBC38DRAFT_465574 [Podospora fimiseda]|uniref:Uncharacterized protein n=1 Tax=Podospora fimiseda TaxID=252190 RepID=A0AAN7BY58_9PEZI|nr:hypothetical protein QBC38DRAFT_465574 [Podospora fimiseda]